MVLGELQVAEQVSRGWYTPDSWGQILLLLGLFWTLPNVSHLAIHLYLLLYNKPVNMLL